MVRWRQLIRSRDPRSRAVVFAVTSEPVVRARAALSCAALLAEAVALAGITPVGPVAAASVYARASGPPDADQLATGALGGPNLNDDAGSGG